MWQNFKSVEIYNYQIITSACRRWLKVNLVGIFHFVRSLSRSCGSVWYLTFHNFSFVLAHFSIDFFLLFSNRVIFHSIKNLCQLFQTQTNKVWCSFTTWKIERHWRSTGFCAVDRNRTWFHVLHCRHRDRFKISVIVFFRSFQ